MPIKSLAALCVRTATRNIHEINSVGDCDFRVVRDILERVQSAERLRRIEENSPQIRGETAELWQKLINRDFTVEARKKRYAPSDPALWSRVYRRYERERQTTLARDTAALRESLAKMQADKEQKNLSMNARLRPPRNLPLGRSRGAGRGAGSTSTIPNGTRTRTDSPAGLMKKVRREATQIKSIRNHLLTPSGTVAIRNGSGSGSGSGPGSGSALGTVNKAPAAMLNDRRIANQPTYRSSISTSPASKTAIGSPVQQKTDRKGQSPEEPDNREWNYLSDLDCEDDGDELLTGGKAGGVPRNKRRLNGPQPSETKHVRLVHPARRPEVLVTSRKAKPDPSNDSSIVKPRLPPAAASPPSLPLEKPTQTPARSQPSTPAPAVAPTSGPEVLLRKRKAPDIFMRRPPKKRTA